MTTSTRLTTIQWVKGNVMPSGTDIFAYVAVARNLDGREVVEINFLDNFNYRRKDDMSIVLLDKGVEGWAILNIPYPAF